MSNHAPVFTTSEEDFNLTELSGTTGSSTPDQVSGTFNFKDSDKTDTHTTSASLRSAVWSGGSGIPAATLADIAHALSSTIQSDSNGTGKIAWSFSVQDHDFDFLAKNETLTLTYNVIVSDNHGGSATQTVKIVVTGTDDAPSFDVATLATVNEQTDQILSLTPDTASIALHFTDVDLDDHQYTATVTGASASGATEGLLPGPLGTAELLAFYHVDSIVKTTGTASGTINTTFSAPDLAFDYLAAGQQLNITYQVKLDDGKGGVSTQNVIVTVVGSNDKPIYLSGPESAHLTEGQNLTAGNQTAHGDLFFTDIDLADTHVVSETVTATRSGGGAIPLTNVQLLAAMGTTLEDSTHHLIGEVDWDFALPDSQVSFLQGGETLTLDYKITVTDPAGGSATQDVFISVLGVNHPVTITSGPQSASVAEQADTTGSGSLDSTTPVPTGTIAFTDQDTSDTHTVAVSIDSETSSGGAGIPAATQADLLAALQTTLHDSTGTGSGGIDWSFSIPDHDLDFLGANDTLTITYDVKVSDASTSATQTVTITATGANDAPFITTGPESASVDEQPNTVNSSTPDTAPTQTLSFGDPDLSDIHQVSVVLDSAVWSVNPFFVPGQTFADLQAAITTTLHDSTGTGSGSIDWSFSVPDKDLDFLGHGETLTATYDIVVSDGFTNSTQTVTVTMNGAADAPTINPLTATIQDTTFQDAGTTVLFGNLITDAGDTGDASNTLTVTSFDGVSFSGELDVSDIYGTLSVFSDGTYFYFANSALDALQIGDNPTEHFNFTVTDSASNDFATTLTLNIVGVDDAPQITSATPFGSVTEDAGPPVLVNGGFETGDLSGWTPSGAVFTEFTGIGGNYGNYSAALENGSLTQDLATTPGQHYTVSFDVSGDPESSGNSFNAFWDGSLILAVGTQFDGFTHYTFDLVGDSSFSFTELTFSGVTDGSGLLLDRVSVTADTPQGTETTSGNIAFSDLETADTHTASFVPQNGGYVGTFSLDPASESGGSGSVDWHFTVNNSDIQFLAQGQSLTQTYSVFITDNNGASTEQDVTVTLNGSNDAPTANDDHVITDVGAGVVGLIPGWALAHNDTDPDTIDTLTIANVSSGTDLLAGQSGADALFLDDATLGGSFTYQASDGIALSTNTATVTVDNNAATSTTLNATSGDTILIGNNSGEALNGASGNDVLIANSTNQTLTGGGGNDIFAFEQMGTGPNATIADFNNTSAHDLLAASANGFGGGLTPGMDASTVFETSADDSFQSSASRFHYNSASDTLSFSPDGTDASAVVVAHLQPGVTLTGHDFVIVA